MTPTEENDATLVQRAADMIYAETWYLSIEDCQAIARDIIKLVREYS
jgi:hypothetical protein